MRKCKTCDGNGELLVDGMVDPREPHLRAAVDTETCPDCGGTGQVKNNYVEQYN